MIVPLSLRQSPFNRVLFPDNLIITRGPHRTSEMAFDAASPAQKLFSKQLLYPLHCVLRCESQLLHHYLNRRGSSVTVEADHVAFLTDVFRPAQTHAGFDRESRVDFRREHFVAVSSRLFFK